MTTQTIERVRIRLSPAEWRWLGIALVALSDLILMTRTGIRVAPALLESYAILLLPWAVIFLVYSRWRSHPGISALAQGALQAILFAMLARLLSYLVLAFQAPLMDETFSALDARLGLDWLSLFGWVQSHPILRDVMILAYQSTSWQFLMIMLLLPLLGRKRYLSEFLTATMLALLVIIPVWGFAPAVSAWVHYGVGLAEPDWLPDVLAMRAGTMPVLGAEDMHGIIAFPSFHTVLAMLVTYATRWSRAALTAAMLLNGVLILSVPIVGSHYFVDVLAGAAVALAAMRAASWIEGRSAAAAAISSVP